MSIENSTWSTTSCLSIKKKSREINWECVNFITVTSHSLLMHSKIKRCHLGKFSSYVTVNTKKLLPAKNK